MVTGKPDPAMHAECVRRTGAERPVVVGDRLDTDIEGARRAGAASLLVLSGVTDAAALLAARPVHRPDLLSADASGLLSAHPEVVPDGAGWRCGSWWAGVADGGVLTLRSAGDQAGSDDGLDGLRALCVAHWRQHPEGGVTPRLGAAGDAARRALARRALEGWGLPPG
jgi:hypothetical protein